MATLKQHCGMKERATTSGSTTSRIIFGCSGSASIRSAKPETVSISARVVYPRKDKVIMSDELVMKTEQPKFNTSFPRYACTGDDIETSFNGLTIVATIEHDPGHSIIATMEHDYCSLVLSLRKGVLSHRVGALRGIEYNHPDSGNAHLTAVANTLIAENWQSILGIIENLRAAKG